MFSQKYIIYIKKTSIMCLVIYSYTHECETNNNAKFYIVRSLKYSVRLDTNQTHMKVICYGEKIVTDLLQFIRIYVIDE
jgi:hypothetical protein